MDTGEMRELIIGLDTFNLAEQAGIVCDTLDDIVVPDVDLSVAQFIFEAFRVVENKDLRVYDR